MTTEDKYGYDERKSKDEINRSNNSSSKTKNELDIEFKELSNKLKTILKKQPSST
jgi:hypothetical protein